jgi:hypothetical protein
MSDRRDLDRLRARFGDRYWIRCTDRTWIATDRDPDTGTAPTLMADSAEELAEQMLSPGPRVGMPFPSGMAAHP